MRRGQGRSARRLPSFADIENTARRVRLANRSGIVDRGALAPQKRRSTETTPCGSSRSKSISRPRSIGRRSRPTNRAASTSRRAASRSATISARSWTISANRASSTWMRRGVDLQVLSFNGPVAPGFAADETIAMAKELNDRLAAADHRAPETLRRICRAADRGARRRRRRARALRQGSRLRRRDDPRPHQRGVSSTTRNSGRSSSAPKQLDVPIYLHPTLPNPRRAQGLFRGLRGHHRASRLGLRRRYQHPFPAHPVRGRVRRLSEAADHHGPSGRGLALRDASPQRSHLSGRETARPQEDAARVHPRPSCT